MNQKFLLTSLALGLVWSVSAAPKVVAYLPNWSDYATFGKYAPDYTGLPPKSVLKELTHVMAFSIWPNSTSAGGTVDGHLAAEALSPNARFNALIDSAHAVGTKAMIVLGGWDNQGPATAAFCTIAKSASYRALFASDIKKVVVEQGYDGIDLDWEHPTYNGCSFSDFKTLTKQIKDSLKTATTKAGAAPLFSMAVNPTFSSNMNSAGTSAEWTAIFDFINLMTYDSPFSSAPTTTYTYLNTWTPIMGNDMTKLTLGMPFYGWGSGCGTGAVDPYYRTLLVKSRATTSPITALSTSYNGCTFNGIAITSKLTDSAVTKGAGVMFWDLNQDVWIGDTLSQLRAVKNTLNKRTGISSAIPVSSWAPPSSSSVSSSSINFSSHTDYSCPTTWSTLPGAKVSVKDVYTSSKGVSYPAAQAIDGDTLTSWVGNNATDWLTLSFAQAFDIGKLELKWVSNLYRPAEMYMMTSLDSLTWDTVVTQHYVPTGKIAANSWTPKSARYVRYQGITALTGPIYLTEAKAFVCGTLPSSSSALSSSSVDNTPLAETHQALSLENQSGKFMVRLGQNSQLQVRVFDLSGKMHTQFQGSFKSGLSLLPLNLSAGHWNVEISNGSQTQRFSVVQP